MTVSISFDHMLIDTVGSAGPYGTLGNGWAKNGRYFYAPNSQPGGAAGYKLAVFDRGPSNLVPSMSFVGQFAQAAGCALRGSGGGSINPARTVLVWPAQANTSQRGLLCVYDVSNPAAPSYLGPILTTYWTTPSGTQQEQVMDVAWVDAATIAVLTHVITTSNSTDYLFFTLIDMTTPLAPVVLATTSHRVLSSFQGDCMLWAGNRVICPTQGGYAYMDFTSHGAVTDGAYATAGGPSSHAPFADRGLQLVGGRYAYEHIQSTAQLGVNVRDLTASMAVVGTSSASTPTGYQTIQQPGAISDDGKYLFHMGRQTIGAVYIYLLASNMGAPTAPVVQEALFTGSASTAAIDSSSRLRSVQGQVFYENGHLYVPIGNFSTRQGMEVYQVPELIAEPIIGTLSAA